MAAVGPFSTTLFTLCKSRDLPEPIFDTQTLATGYGATVNFHSGMAMTSTSHKTVANAKEDVARQALMKLCVRETNGVNGGKSNIHFTIYKRSLII